MEVRQHVGSWFDFEEQILNGIDPYVLSWEGIEYFLVLLHILSHCLNEFVLRPKQDGDKLLLKSFGADEVHLSAEQPQVAEIPDADIPVDGSPEFGVDEDTINVNVIRLINFITAFKLYGVILNC